MVRDHGMALHISERGRSVSRAPVVACLLRMALHRCHNRAGWLGRVSVVACLLRMALHRCHDRIVGVAPLVGGLRGGVAPPASPAEAQLPHPCTPKAPTGQAQASEIAICSSASIASCMPPSMPDSMCASRCSLQECSTRIDSVVRPSTSSKVRVFSASPSGNPS
jgi:hypothetical protein